MCLQILRLRNKGDRIKVLDSLDESWGLSDDMRDEQIRLKGDIEELLCKEDVR